MNYTTVGLLGLVAGALSVQALRTITMTCFSVALSSLRLFEDMRPVAP
jgi:hypothetical protein